MLVLAVPGLVIALSFTYLTEHFLRGRFYQTSPLLVLAYAIMFFPLAVVSVRAAVARSPVGLEEVGQFARREPSLGAVACNPAPHRSRSRRRVRARLLGDGHRADGDAGAPSRPTSRPWPPSSGPTSRTSRTARPHRTRASWCSSPPYPATCWAAGSTASPRARPPSLARPCRRREISGAGMKDLAHQRPDAIVRCPARPARRGPDRAARVVHRDPRRVGQRQDDPAAHRRRVRAPRRRPDRAGRRDRRRRRHRFVP